LDYTPTLNKEFLEASLLIEGLFYKEKCGLDGENDTYLVLALFIMYDRQRVAFKNMVYGSL
jgi:hypothetical protein